MEWLAVLAMGLILGLMGGGGGILTVPILVTFFGMRAEAATGASLLIVGLASSVGAAQSFFRKEYDPKPVVPFAVFSVLGAFLSRKLLVPSLPLSAMGLTKDQWLLLALGVLMIVIAVRLLAPTKAAESGTKPLWVTAVAGMVIGILSGTLGAGGGFLIVPALTLLLGMEFKVAVPTSLFIITIQSLGGFAGEIGKPVPYATLWPIVGVSLAAMLIATPLRSKIPADTLRIAFAVLVLAVAAFTFSKIF